MQTSYMSYMILSLLVGFRHLPSLEQVSVCGPAFVRLKMTSTNWMTVPAGQANTFRCPLQRRTPKSPMSEKGRRRRRKNHSDDVRLLNISMRGRSSSVCQSLSPASLQCAHEVGGNASYCNSSDRIARVKLSRLLDASLPKSCYVGSAMSAWPTG